MHYFIKVIPSAKKNELVGTWTDAQGKTYHKIRLTAPAIDGKANKALIKFLSEHCDVAASHITITHGLTSHMKTVLIKNAKCTMLNAK